MPGNPCDNIRIKRCRIYPREEHKEAFRGYVASKRRYFYGLRVHLLVSGSGEPVEFSLASASEADIKVFKEMDLDLPEGATIHAEAKPGYTDYHYEDLLEEVGVKLISQSRLSKKEEIQTSTFGIYRVFGEAHPPVHRNGLQQAECVVFEEDPRSYAEGL